MPFSMYRDSSHIVPYDDDDDDDDDESHMVLIVAHWVKLNRSL